MKTNQQKQIERAYRRAMNLRDSQAGRVPDATEDRYTRAYLRAWKENDARGFVSETKRYLNALQKVAHVALDDAGQAIAEFAAILPVFVLVGFILVDIQWMTRTAAAIEYVVNETARCEAIASNVCAAPHTPQSYATDLARNLRLGTGAELELSTPPCTPDSCSVEIRYHYKPLGAWFPAMTIARTGTASLPPQVPAP